MPPKSLTPDAQDALLRYSWPGNVRELSNVMERVALIDDDPIVDAASLGLAEPSTPTHQLTHPPAPVPLGDAIGAVVRERLLEALRSTRWNISRAATLLGMPRNTLRYQIEKHRLRPDDTTAPAQAADTDMGTPTPAADAGPVSLGERSAFLIGAAVGAFSAPAASLTSEDAEPIDRDAPAVVLPRWERRHVALLRAALVQPSENFVADGGQGLQMLVEKVQSFGGRLEELSPTGVVAAFGLEPIEDAPTRAGLAAMAIQKATQHAQRLDGERITVTIGVHTTQTMIGRIAGAVAIDESVKRQACGVLDELVDRAPLDTILVSHAAAPFLERRFDLVPLAVAGESNQRTYRLTVLTTLIRGAAVARLREPVTLESVFFGIGFIRNTRVLLGIMSLDLFAVLLGGATALLPIFARDILGTGPWGLGVLRSARRRSGRS